MIDPEVLNTTVREYLVEMREYYMDIIQPDNLAELASTMHCAMFDSDDEFEVKLANAEDAARIANIYQAIDVVLYAIEDWMEKGQGGDV